MGQNASVVRTFLEKNYKGDMSQEDAVKLAIQALLEVVQSGAKNMDVVVMTSDLQLIVKKRRCGWEDHALT